MQYMPCNHALLAQEALFLTQKGTVFQIYKSFGKTPPPCWEKFPNNVVFFWQRTLAFYFISHNMTHSINQYHSWPPTLNQVILYDTKSMLLTEHMLISRGFLSPNFNCSLKRRNHRSFLHLRLHLFLHLPTIIAWRMDLRLQAQRAIEYIFNHIIQTTSIMISIKHLTLFSHPPALRS